ncbi:PAS domain S-box-containing protein/diguanylate cyclase (GGDEF) domain-containing protein [Paenibacillus polysaccharolyticus]|uniref:PAS domain S-box-containing protein/diguanylate cyclase (GGDEF) domain-containing protein n=1 Tax=Paenibacillus polysaccharolyticus TaxID=582692 RepID=A0A1G5I659_9BACL|nr:bifunctional diguanylate cyclase/phosphodiesterase [Paenibacillus polysaccharolyticus]SCY71444.1 PAS domain S-box-containing protein/diguanylate cyclase (GGDEF) domain-containing protein [Paenibacillus polysaccharolyticus]
MEHIHGTYNLQLVILSYFIASLASYAALDLAGRVSLTSGKARHWWVACGAISMGLGIWSMHFVGMIAFVLPMHVSYSMDKVILSVLLAIIASGVALEFAGRPSNRISKLVFAGLLLTAGITSMHYVGMAAMSIPITYKPGLVVLSVLIAALASYAALWLMFFFNRPESKHHWVYKIGSGLIMGLAITGMHYTGMAAAQFHQVQVIPESLSRQVESEVLAYLIAAGTIVAIGLTLFGNFINQRMIQKDQRIHENEQWYHALYHNHSDAIVSVDREGIIKGINAVVTTITGYPEKRVIDRPINQIIEQISVQCSSKDNAHTWDNQELQQRHYMAKMRNTQNELLDLSIAVIPVIIDDTHVGSHILIKDITEETQAQQNIRHQALHDPLTGLPNRRKLDEVLATTINVCEQQKQHKFAVMVMDIDRFKMINDSLGHSIGDVFLKEVSNRIITVIEASHPQATSNVTLARMGGDEFTMVVTGEQADEKQVVRLAEKIVEAIKQPYRLKENDFYVTASIGIAMYPEHGVGTDALIKHADSAMYEVKKNGKNGYQFYTAQLDSELYERIELEGYLRKALERNEMVLYYQPQIRTLDSRMIGVEALIRWQHPLKGLLAPDVFIPLAEETGMIYDIGNWTIREACRQMKLWHASGGPLIPVSVNLSSQQFHQSNLVEQVQNALTETGLEAKYLELEITESMMMDAAVSTAILNELSALGVKISLDDFGTGYSSLSYLKHFPIHKLKIDRSFVTDITESHSDQAIVATIISMAQNLKMEVIAEGIETKGQLDILMQNDCREIQGYYFSRPLPANEVENNFFVPLRLLGERNTVFHSV